MTTTIAPQLEPEHVKAGQGPVLVADPPSRSPAQASSTYPSYLTQGRKIGADPYDDPTQGRKIGSDPYDDPTRGLA